eukprot:3947400-Pleurochrysis_carterae.AAC.1
MVLLTLPWHALSLCVESRACKPSHAAFAWPGSHLECAASAVTAARVRTSRRCPCCLRRHRAPATAFARASLDALAGAPSGCP